MLWHPEVFAQTEQTLMSNESNYVLTKNSKVRLQSNDFFGYFTRVQGRISTNDSSQVTCFDLVIDVNSLTFNMEGMAQHAKSADFFDAGNYPTITFFGKDMVLTDSTTSVDGMMRAKGVEIEKNIPFTVLFMPKNVVKLEAAFSIKRSDFGIGDIDVVSDEVLVFAELLAKKK
ncbi:MAG: YceI family protein [Bacteroidetes bacterium]|nr:YceI family protein [Bacteroidota bacterium]